MTRSVPPGLLVGHVRRPRSWALLLSAVLPIVLMIAPVSSAASAPHVAPPGAWEQFHGDASLDGVSSSVLNPTNTTLFPTVDLTKYTGAVASVTGNPYPYQASPVTDGSDLIVPYGNYVMDLSASTGQPVWQSFTPLPGGPGAGPIAGTPLLTPTMVYADESGSPNDLVAISLTNGTQMWSSAPTTCGFSCTASSSVVEGGGYLAVTTQGGILAWHLPVAGNLWNYQHPGGGVAVYTSTPSYAYLAGTGQWAFVLPSTASGLQAFLAPPTGGNVPGFPMTPGGGFRETLVSSAAMVNLTYQGITNTFAFFGGDAGTRTPSYVWAVDMSQPSVHVALSVPALGNPSDGIWDTPAVVVNGLSPNRAAAYFGTQDGQVLNATFAWTGGSQVGFTLGWSFQAAGAIDGSPVVAGSEVLVGSADAAGTFYALHTSDGTLAWSATTGSPIYASAAVSGGSVYIVTSAGKLYAFGTSPGGGGTPSINGPGPSTSDLLYTLLAVIAVIAVAAVVLVYLHRRGKHPPTTSPPPSSDHMPAWAPPPHAAHGAPPPSSPGPYATPPASYPPPPPSTGSPSVPGSHVPPPPTTAEVGYDEPGSG